MRKAVDLLGDYFKLAGGIALAIGLILQYPGTRYPISLKAQNPLFLVDILKFKDLIPKANLSPDTIAILNRSLPVAGVHWQNEQQIPIRRVIVMSYREKYFGIRSVQKSSATATAPDQSIYLRTSLRNVKTVLGYSDRDTGFESPIRSFQKFSNPHTIRELTHSPELLYDHLWRFDLFSPGISANSGITAVAHSHYFPPGLVGDINFNRVSVNSVTTAKGTELASAYALYFRDPFYLAGEQIKNSQDKIKYYSALLQCSSFISLFTLENHSSRTIHDVGITVNTENISAVMPKSLPDYYNVSVSTAGNGLYELKVNTIRPGNHNYKLIALVGDIVDADRVSLDSRDVIAKIEEFALLILLAPMLIIGVTQFLEQASERTITSTED